MKNLIIREDKNESDTQDNNNGLLLGKKILNYLEHYIDHSKRQVKSIKDDENASNTFFDELLSIINLKFTICKASILLCKLFNSRYLSNGLIINTFLFILGFVYTSIYKPHIGKYIDRLLKAYKVDTNLINSISASSYNLFNNKVTNESIIKILNWNLKLIYFLLMIMIDDNLNVKFLNLTLGVLFFIVIANAIILDKIPNKLDDIRIKAFLILSPFVIYSFEFENETIILLIVHSLYSKLDVTLRENMNSIKEWKDKLLTYRNIIENMTTGAILYSPINGNFYNKAVSRYFQTNGRITTNLLFKINSYEKNKTSSFKTLNNKDLSKTNDAFFEESSWAKHFTINNNLSKKPLNSFPFNNNKSNDNYLNKSLQEVVVMEESKYIKEKDYLPKKLLYLGIYNWTGDPNKLFEIYKTPYKAVKINDKTSKNKCFTDTKTVRRKLSFNERRDTPNKLGYREISPIKRPTCKEFGVSTMKKISSDKSFKLSNDSESLKENEINIINVSRSNPSNESHRHRKMYDLDNFCLEENEVESPINHFEKFKELEKTSECVYYIYEITDIINLHTKFIDNKYKNIFLSKMSHEIKTPCIAISCNINKVENLLYTILSKYHYQCLLLETIKIQSLLDQIINVVTTISEYVRGLDRTEIQNDDINLADQVRWGYWMARGILDSEEKSSSYTSHTFSSNIVKPVLKLPFIDNNDEDERSFHTTTDLNKLRIIISEILKNSIKNTSKGEISLEFKIEENHKILTIIDTGKGIKRQKLNEIYTLWETIEQVFYDELSENRESKPKNKTSSKHVKNSVLKCENIGFSSNAKEFALRGGLGLGLQFVKVLCLRLNIDVSLISQEGLGTTIILKFLEFRVKDFKTFNQNLLEIEISNPTARLAYKFSNDKIINEEELNNSINFSSGKIIESSFIISSEKKKNKPSDNSVHSFSFTNSNYKLTGLGKIQLDNSIERIKILFRPY